MDPLLPFEIRMFLWLVEKTREQIERLPHIQERVMLEEWCRRGRIEVELYESALKRRTATGEAYR